MKGTVLDGAALRMAADDTVASVLEDVEHGRTLRDVEPPLAFEEEVPFGHKVALVDHEAGDPVRKYGEVIGEATEAIPRGAWVHTHNCESTRGRGDRAAPTGGES